MHKKGTWVLWVSISLVIILLVASYFYFVLFNPNNAGLYLSNGQEALKNPAENLAVEEAVQQFNETFVLYLLYQAKAYNLHNPPLSSEIPVIEVVVEDSSYTGNVQQGIISVSRGIPQKKDIVLTTTKEEAVKMMKNPSYVKESFSSGASAIELVEDKTTLFSKGYLGLYTELTGKSITGNIVRIYLD